MAGSLEDGLINGGIGAVSGATYGFIIFARKREDGKRETEEWNYMKMLPTVFVAAVIGAIDGYTIGPEALTIESMATRLATYGGVIFAVEQIFKTIRDRVRNRRRTAAERIAKNDEKNGDTNK